MPSKLVNAAGLQVGAVRGFASFLLRYLREQEPTHLALCFDESLTTCFRNDLFPAYKAHRELPDAELIAQLDGCREVAEALGLACFADERFEADDFIATLAGPLVKRGHSVVITSIDKDLTQLVGPRVKFFDFAKDNWMGRSEVLEKFGVEPHQIPDFLGLAGDQVDGIPGVTRVGPVAAAALLQAFENLEAIYADLTAVTQLPVRGAKGLAQRLEAEKELAFLSRELATLSTDAPAKANLGPLKLKAAKPDDVRPAFERYGFAAWADRVPGAR